MHEAGEGCELNIHKEEDWGFGLAEARHELASEKKLSHKHSNIMHGASEGRECDIHKEGDWGFGLAELSYVQQHLARSRRRCRKQYPQRRRLGLWLGRS